MLNPVTNSDTTFVPLFAEHDLEKRQANQRYSEVEPTSFGRQLQNIARFSNLKRSPFKKDSVVKIESIPIEESSSKKSSGALNSIS